MGWYLDVLKKYAVSEGRARRQEFWAFMFVSFCVGVGLSYIDEALGLGPGGNAKILEGLYGLGVFLPSLGVTARRLHDTNRSAGYLLLLLIPILGWFFLVMFVAQEGTRGSNQYGPDPKRPQKGRGGIAIPHTQ